MKKILIVSRHFPPMNTMASKRFGYMCKYMQEYGWEPFIIASCARNGGYLNSKTDLMVPVPEDHIERIGMMGVSYPVDNLLIEILLNGANKNGGLRVFESGSWGWYEKVRKNISDSFLREASLVLGTFPSAENLLVAKYISSKYNIPYVADIRDLMSDFTEGYYRDNITTLYERISERVILSNAAGIICTTEGFRKVLKKRYRTKPVKVIYNGWDEALSNREYLAEDKTEDYIYYAGSLYEHRLESLELLLIALSKLKSTLRMKIRSLGPGNLEARLYQMICRWDLESKVVILPAAEESVIRREQDRAIINLLPSSIDDKDSALMSTLPGKLFELLYSERPILAVVSANTELGHILQSTNKGMATTEVDKMIAFLNGGYKKYSGNDQIELYSRRNQTKHLCYFLDRVMTLNVNFPKHFWPDASNKL